MKRLFSILFLVFCLQMTLCAQTEDVRDIRHGNRKFRGGNYRMAEIDYRRAQAQDSTSIAANYNLGNSLYRQKNYEDASKMLSKISEETLAGSEHASKVFFNQGDVALQKKDYASAVKAFKEALKLDPADMDAKENYTYAKLMLQNQQNQDQSQQDQNKDQDQDQNKDQNQDQNQQDQNQDQQDQNQDKQDQQQPQEQQSKISPQQAQQMLQAIQAKEKETQDKVDKKKAAALQSKQKEKNW